MQNTIAAAKMQLVLNFITHHSPLDLQFGYHLPLAAICIFQASDLLNDISIYDRTNDSARQQESLNIKGELRD
jgi:hypothetical protein